VDSQKDITHYLNVRNASAPHAYAPVENKGIGSELAPGHRFLPHTHGESSISYSKNQRERLIYKDHLSSRYFEGFALESTFQAV
jgi:hypothetical protein